MDTMFGKKIGKCMRFCLVIIYTGLLNNIDKGRTRKAMMTEGKQSFTITVSRQRKGSKGLQRKISSFFG